MNVWTSIQALFMEGVLGRIKALEAKVAELESNHLTVTSTAPAYQRMTLSDVSQAIADRVATALNADQSRDSFRGMVIDSGGGQVTILVDRDTSHYPPKGQYVTVQKED